MSDNVSMMRHLYTQKLQMKIKVAIFSHHDEYKFYLKYYVLFGDS